MTCYTAAEILAAGRRDTLESLATLYLELDQATTEADYWYHQAFVAQSHAAVAGEPGRLEFHAAPAGFGGNELAIPARRVDPTRLTPAGLQLYFAGMQDGLTEAENIRTRTAQAIDTAARLQVQATTGAAARISQETIAQLQAAQHREQREAHAAESTPPLIAWADAPVRIPGTTNYITA